ncbi:hypothetical protein EBU71_08625, partial [bacterium]|nr:hypothetical protein [Candidatus Elulimicrobium humile]
MSDQNVHPEIAEVDWIDDAFRIEETRFKTWRSYTKDGKEAITSSHRDTCIAATRFYLKGCQEGWIVTKTYEGLVG